MAAAILNHHITTAQALAGTVANPTAAAANGTTANSKAASSSGSAASA
jgi:hypothetical protein